VGRNNRGFTLVEMMIAMVIILIAMLGMYKTVIVAIEGNTRTVLRNDGNKLAEEIINKIRALPYDDIAVQAPWTATEWTNSLGIVPPFTRKLRKIDAEYSVVVNVTLNAPLKVVNVIVGWDFKGDNPAKATNVTAKEFEQSVTTVVRSE